MLTSTRPAAESCLNIGSEAHTTISQWVVIVICSPQGTGVGLRGYEAHSITYPLVRVLIQGHLLRSQYLAHAAQGQIVPKNAKAGHSAAADPGNLRGPASSGRI
jgi:hypothetical protein